MITNTQIPSARTQDLSDVSRMIGVAKADLETLIILGQLERKTPN